jgi:hypothetical protein
MACGASAHKRIEPRLAAVEPPVAWTYDVHEDGPNLRVEGSFTATKGASLATDDDATPFVSGVEFFSAGSWRPAPNDAGRWTPSCLPSGCRIRYTFALAEAASRIDSGDTALAAGGVVVSPPSTWLLRPTTPSGDSPEGTLRIRVTGGPFASAMARSASAPDFFEASTWELDAASFTVFGSFREATVHSGRAALDVAMAPSGLAMTPSEVQTWIERAVAGIAAYYGSFPTPRTLVVVVPGTAAVTEGETLGDGGAAVLIRTGRGVTASQANDDWVVIHELLHVTLPSLGRDELWLSEGLATYVEPIIRARAGIVSVERYWSDLVAGLPQGLPDAGDEGLEKTHTWGRTYWGGALFCLLADVRIREATKNARSLDDALRRIVATGANVSSHWSIDQFLDEGGRGAGVQVLRDLFREMGLAPGTADLGALWRRLGVQPRPGGGVLFDERAELAWVRRAITAPQLND